MSIAARAPALGAAVHTLAGRSMGTSWNVKFAGPAGLDTAALTAAVQSELDLVVAQMSHWEPGSNLGRFNRAPAGSEHALPPVFAEVLACALEVAAASGGAFDPAAGALVDLWGFGPTGRFDEPGFAPPDDAAVAAALAQSGWLKLRVDQGRAHQPGGVQLDLSAIAKGYAVDRVARRLVALGFGDSLVEVGGELRGSGIRPDGQPWWVALAQPDGSAPSTRVALHGLSVATSGDYVRAFTGPGSERRAHTIDPRSGRPVEHGLASVSVLHAECMLADAWSTALTVLGTERGLALAARMGIAALFVQRREDGGFDEHPSPALAELAE